MIVSLMREELLRTILRLDETQQRKVLDYILLTIARHGQESVPVVPPASGGHQSQAPDPKFD